jgi:hypothetical protein
MANCSADLKSRDQRIGCFLFEKAVKEGEGPFLPMKTTNASGRSSNAYL